MGAGLGCVSGFLAAALACVDSRVALLVATAMAPASQDELEPGQVWGDGRALMDDGMTGMCALVVEFWELGCGLGMGPWMGQVRSN